MSKLLRRRSAWLLGMVLAVALVSGSGTIAAAETPAPPVTETGTPTPSTDESPSATPTPSETVTPTPTPTISEADPIYDSANRAMINSLPEAIESPTPHDTYAWNSAVAQGTTSAYAHYAAGWGSGNKYVSLRVKAYEYTAYTLETTDSDLPNAAEKAIGYHQKAIWWDTVARPLALLNAQAAQNRVAEVYAAFVPRADGVEVTPKLEGVTVVDGSNGLVVDTASPFYGKVTATIAVGGCQFSWISEAGEFKQYVVMSSSLADATVSVSDQTWTGAQVRPAVQVTLNNTALNAVLDYTVSYGTNKLIGKGSVTVTGAGNYTGSKVTVFKIVPKPTKVTKIKAGKKSAKVSVTRASKAQKVTKAQVQYRLVGTSAWKTKTFSEKAKSVKLKGLKRKGLYEFRTIVYKTVGGTRYYSPPSPTRTKRVK